MSVAIHTKYIGPTDKTGSRVKAYTHRGWDEGRAIVWSVTVPFDHSGREHEQAAEALIRKYWPAVVVDRLTYVGSSADGKGDVYVWG